MSWCERIIHGVWWLRLSAFAFSVLRFLFVRSFPFTLCLDLSLPFHRCFVRSFIHISKRHSLFCLTIHPHRDVATRKHAACLCLRVCTRASAMSIDSFASIVQLVAIRSRETVLLFILSVLLRYKFVARFETFFSSLASCVCSAKDLFVCRCIKCWTKNIRTFSSFRFVLFWVIWNCVNFVYRDRTVPNSLRS